MQAARVISSPQIGREDLVRLRQRHTRGTNANPVLASANVNGNENEGDGVAVGVRGRISQRPHEEAANLDFGSASHRSVPVYKAFDLRDHYKNGEDPREYLDFDNCASASDLKTPLDHYDVSLSADRLSVPLNLILCPMTRSGNGGMRGRIFIENKSRLNITVFILPSSRSIHVKNAVDWILPNEIYKVHFKTSAPYPKIKDDFIRIYAAPLYFCYQLDLVKLEEFWKGLGSKFNPIEHVDIYNVKNILLCPELQAEMSILDHLSLASLWKKKLIEMPLSREPYNIHQTYEDFWGMNNEDIELELLIAMHEARRAMRRGFDLPRVLLEWRNWICSGISVVAGTFLVICVCNGTIKLDEFDPKLFENFLKELPVTWFMEKAFLEETDETPPLFEIPPPPAGPNPTMEIPVTEPAAWDGCFAIPEMDQPRGIASYISHCLLNKAKEVIIHSYTYLW